jgi:hypothetical protein
MPILLSRERAIPAAHHEAHKKTALAQRGGLRMVPAVGFELTTYRLQGGCSTN